MFNYVKSTFVDEISICAMVCLTLPTADRATVMKGQMPTFLLIPILFISLSNYGTTT
jgi:hypothetical protein